MPNFHLIQYQLHITLSESNSIMLVTFKVIILHNLDTINMYAENYFY